MVAFLWCFASSCFSKNHSDERASEAASEAAEPSQLAANAPPFCDDAGVRKTLMSPTLENRDNMFVLSFWLVGQWRVAKKSVNEGL